MHVQHSFMHGQNDLGGELMHLVSYTFHFSMQETLMIS